MTNPVLADVLRGDQVESRHRGSVVVCDASGKTIMAVGDTNKPVFPRSAVKSIQALPFVESGAADAYGFGNRELALACASHNGEPEHASLAQSMLERAGLSEADMECGVHWPTLQKSALDLASSGRQPNQLHNNCSGKHSGFLCTCAHEGIDPTGYVGADHRLQEMVRDAMENVTGAKHDPAHRGTDGCSIPTYAIPLKNMALGFARMATGEGLAPQRAAAAKRLFEACMAEPFLVAGTDRADTKLMQAAPGKIMVKIGAEGVFCAAIPSIGVGIALKCDDGAARAAEAIVARVLEIVLRDDKDLGPKLKALANPVFRNWNGIEVGGIRTPEAYA
ncbi:asparaginase [Tianweitania sp. BSSL-BM11]|uniref:Asparaginase n=1 Tax=Tianweitania aestuarii TaxID=2814886 RepID=A0ABS5RSA2_9HYPH|nr:asparaginase [Tianweitania aestuarii]MBS9719842.1 asparaginase [Tianweitania aestuarii]